jgi:hypothetical protein
MATTRTFDLPFGYEGGDGTTHKTVVMRRVRNEDLVAVANNERIQDLAREGIKINLSSIEPDNIQIGSSAGVKFNGEMEPISMHLVQAAMAELNSLLFAQVILKLGIIENPSGEVLLQLSPVDMNVIQEHYNEFNQPPVDKKQKETELAANFPCSLESLYRGMHWLAKSMEISPNDVLEMEFVDFIVWTELEMEYNQKAEERSKKAAKR